MSTAETWDLVVPEDDAELVAAFRRHGVQPGRRLWVLETADDQTVDSDELRRALVSAHVAAEALASVNSHVAEALIAAIGPQLQALAKSTRNAVAHSMRTSLDAAELAALATVAHALEDALKAASTRRATESPAEQPPRRRLGFTGMIEAEP